MTARELLIYFEQYYGGRYAGAFLDTMLAYLGNCTGAFLDACRKVVTLRYTNTYGKLPDVAVIENNIKEIEASIPREEPLPEPRAERCSPEDYEEIGRIIHGLFRRAGEPVKARETAGGENAPPCIPPGTRLGAEKSDSCEGCFFEGRKCAGLISCLIGGENYIYKLQEAS